MQQDTVLVTLSVEGQGCGVTLGWTLLAELVGWIEVDTVLVGSTELVAGTYKEREGGMEKSETEPEKGEQREKCEDVQQNK